MRLLSDIENALQRPFEDRKISWRPGAVSKDKTSAIALAYIDARDVMYRLDEVFGMNWQCRYSHAEGKTICEIGAKIDGEWIWRAGGAGDTDIEADKGAISDAFKRAAVLWGIGRYLYEVPNKWFPIDEWKKFTQTPTLPSWATPSGWDALQAKAARTASPSESSKSIKKSVMDSFSEEKQDYLRSLCDDVKALLGKPEEAWAFWEEAYFNNDYGADEEVAFKSLFSKSEWETLKQGVTA